MDKNDDTTTVNHSRRQQQSLSSSHNRTNSNDGVLQDQGNNRASNVVSIKRIKLESDDCSPSDKRASTKDVAAASASSFNHHAPIAVVARPEPPLTPFMCFTRFRDDQILSSSTKHPHGRTEESSRVRQIADEWRHLRDDERAYWEEQARKDKIRYNDQKRKQAVTAAGTKGISTTSTGTMISGAATTTSFSKRRAKKNPLAPKRPMSAFLRYSQSRRKILKKQNPDMNNTDISRLLGEMWHSAPEEEKAPHLERELQERAIYKVAIAKWRLEREEAEMEKQQQTTKKTSPDSVRNIGDIEEMMEHETTEAPTRKKKVMTKKNNTTSAHEMKDIPRKVVVTKLQGCRQHETDDEETNSNDPDRHHHDTEAPPSLFRSFAHHDDAARYDDDEPQQSIYGATRHSYNRVGTTTGSNRDGSHGIDALQMIRQAAEYDDFLGGIRRVPSPYLELESGNGGTLRVLPSANGMGSFHVAAVEPPTKRRTMVEEQRYYSSPPTVPGGGSFLHDYARGNGSSNHIRPGSSNTGDFGSQGPVGGPPPPLRNAYIHPSSGLTSHHASGTRQEPYYTMGRGESSASTVTTENRSTKNSRRSFRDRTDLARSSAV